jgi:hypothetical protein
MELAPAAGFNSADVAKIARPWHLLDIADARGVVVLLRGCLPEQHYL